MVLIKSGREPWARILVVAVKVRQGMLALDIYRKNAEKEEEEHEENENKKKNNIKFNNDHLTGKKLNILN